MNAVSVLEERLANGFGCLRSLGYNLLPARSEQSALLGEQWIFRLECPELRRALDIYFSYGSKGVDMMASAFVVALEDGHFGVDDYLRAHDRPDLLEKICSSARPNEQEFYIQNYLSELESICCSVLLPILSGEYWEAVDFDWRGYR